MKAVFCHLLENQFGFQQHHPDLKYTAQFCIIDDLVGKFKLIELYYVF